MKIVAREPSSLLIAEASSRVDREQRPLVIAEGCSRDASGPVLGPSEHGYEPSVLGIKVVENMGPGSTVWGMRSGFRNAMFLLTRTPFWTHFGPM